MAKPTKKRGVRIPYVVDARGDTYDRHAIDVKPTPPYATPLKCKGCGIRVSARHGNADDPDSRTSHFFKLEPHRPTCRYDLDHRGKQLVEASGSTVVRLSGQWRLKCPPIERPGAGGGARKPPGPARPGARGRSKGPRPTSRQAGQAIASARRIVQLLDDFENDPDTLAAFAATAPNGQRNVPWHEFCFARSNAHQLAQALIDGDARAQAIPHAVWGPASTADAAGRNHDSYVVMYIASNPVTIDGTRVKLRVALRSKNPDSIGAATRLGKFLGYGYWELFPKDHNQARTRGWIELQLWVKEAWQAERWDTDGTTIELPEPSRPASSRFPAPAPAPTPVGQPPTSRSARPVTPSDGVSAAPAPSPDPPRNGASENSETPDPRPGAPAPPAVEAEDLHDGARDAVTAQTPTDRPTEVPPMRPRAPSPISGESQVGQRPAPRIPPLPPHPPATADPPPGESVIQRWLRKRRRL